MNLEPAPRLPKWIFFVIDAALLLAAFVIVFFNSKSPYAPLPFVSAVVCVALAAIIGAIPFLTDYAADSAEYVQQEREKVNEQVQRLHAASESLSRAAAQIKAVEEAVHKTAHAAETLPYRMQEKLAEFNEALAEKEAGDREALEEELAELRSTNTDQLKAVAEKVHQAAADWTSLEIATRKQLTLAEAALAKIQAAGTATAEKFEAKITAAVAALDTKLTDRPSSSPVASSFSRETGSAPVATAEPTLDPVVEPASVVESFAVVETQPSTVTPPIVEESKPKKPRLPRKARPEEILAAMSESAPATAEPPHDSGAREASHSVRETAADTSPVESSSSSDGATRLLATAYIGIGNKLFIRGEGPGLSWEKGSPMQFVSIGKWGWASHDAAKTVRCKLYKNDETAALTGEVVLEPGRHVEVTALF
jgi:chemotaxis protein histidine kinase CheA